MKILSVFITYSILTISFSKASRVDKSSKEIKTSNIGTGSGYGYYPKDKKQEQQTKSKKKKSSPKLK